MAACEHFSGKSVLVLGAGVFGSSAALSLATHPFPPSSVTVVDRASRPGPSPDAASSDLNKIIRTSYPDSEMYGQLAARALDEWRGPLLNPFFHPVGLMLSETDGHEKPDYVAGYAPGHGRQGYQLARQLFDQGRVPQAPIALDGAAAKRRALPEGDASLPGATEASIGYIEPTAGWANASAAVGAVVNEAIKAGVRYVSANIVRIDDSVERVVLVAEDGRHFEGDLLVMAAGAWTPSLLPDLDTPEGITPTGQVVACIPLTPAEAKLYAKMPVIFHLSTEYYMFPPNEDDIVKIGIHGFGCTNVNPETGRNEPITGHHHPEACTSASASVRSAGESNIPAEGARALRTCLARLLPELATHDFASTRLCWYTETPDTHFYIDRHPTRKRIVLHTGGSGHGFKFLPILGDLLVQRLEGTLPPEQADAFSATRPRARDHRTIAEKRRRLETSPMATEADLKGSKSRAGRGS